MLVRGKVAVDTSKSKLKVEKWWLVAVTGAAKAGSRVATMSLGEGKSYREKEKDYGEVQMNFEMKFKF